MGDSKDEMAVEERADEMTEAAENAADSEAPVTEQHEEKDDYAAVREEKSLAEKDAAELREMKTSAVPVAVAEIEDDENALMVLKETRDLMKIQVKQGKVRTVTGLVAACLFGVLVVFGITAGVKMIGYLGQGMTLASHAVDQLDTAMGTVGSIERLIDAIGDRLEAMDFAALNNTIGNISDITDDIVKATNDITSVTGDISKATSDIAGTTDALKEFADNLANFRLFGR